jgi:adenosylcobinamide-phosphate synthase
VAILSLLPNPWFLAAGVALDLMFGDPRYAAHPVRLMGWSLARLEAMLRKFGMDGYAGGILLFLLLGGIWAGGVSALITVLPHDMAIAVEIFLIYSLLALRDLLRHGWEVERAATRNDLAGARTAISNLVGRDTSKMDLASCRRAAIESLSENLTDGFVSPIFWYALAGLPGLLLFKVVSTMDSMVGYKTPRYLQFGWCGARTDDLMNWIPARLTWLFISGIALFIPKGSMHKAFVVGWKQHAVVPGPNSGWSEAATAGAIQRKLVGPIWADGKIVTEIWLGDPSDPPAGADGDFPRAAMLVTAVGLFSAALAIAILFRAYL